MIAFSGTSGFRNLSIFSLMSNTTEIEMIKAIEKM